MTKCTPSQPIVDERFRDFALWFAHGMEYLVRWAQLISRRAKSTLFGSCATLEVDSSSTCTTGWIIAGQKLKALDQTHSYAVYSQVIEVARSASTSSVEFRQNFRMHQCYTLLRPASSGSFLRCTFTGTRRSANTASISHLRKASDGRMVRASNGFGSTRRTSLSSRKMPPLPLERISSTPSTTGLTGSVH